MPQAIGRFQLIEKIAVGGMGEVWLAKPMGEDRLVVVKRLLEHLKDDHDLVSLFLDEARIAIGLVHPNIAQIYELGEDKGDYFLVMEFVHGRPFSEVLSTSVKEKDGMPVALMCRVLADAAHALDFAHTAKAPNGSPLNLIHRDVSPQNVLIAYDGSVKLIDFGVAKASTKVNRTATGIIRGKHAYMSPEQAYGKPLDARSDVFGLGIVLWEALCNERLFRRRSPIETLKAVVGAPIEAPSKKDKRVPKALDAIVLKALAREKDARFSGAGEFAQALEQFLVHKRLPASTAHLGAFMVDLFPKDAKRDYADLGPEYDVTAAEIRPIDSPLRVPKLRVIERAPLERFIRELTLAQQTSGVLFNGLSVAVLRLLGPAFDPRVRRVAVEPKQYIDALTYPTADFLRMLWKAADFVAASTDSADEAFEQLGQVGAAAWLEGPSAELVQTIAGSTPGAFVEPFLKTLAPMLVPGERTVLKATQKKVTLRTLKDAVPPAWLGGLIAGLLKGLHKVSVKVQVSVDGDAAEVRLAW